MSDTGILEALDQVPDPQARRGVWPRLAVILSVASEPTLCRPGPFECIPDDSWRCAPTRDRSPRAPNWSTKRWRKHGADSGSRISCTLARIDAAVLSQVVGVWAWLRTSMIDGRRVIAVDGRTLRGAKDAAGASDPPLGGPGPR